MTDPMIQEMETAYATAMRKEGDTHEERKAAATQAVQKYFRPGMKAEEAFKLLRQMKDDGFAGVGSGVGVEVAWIACGIPIGSAFHVFTFSRLDISKR